MSPRDLAGADEPVLVVGGGIVGLSCAWFLRRAGVDVTVLEAGPRTGGGASRGNAGGICPSLVEPLAAPGMVRAALADLRKPDAALYVHPAYLPRMAGFLGRFVRSARSAAYDRGFDGLATLARDVMAAYDALAADGIGTHVRADGYLIVCRTEEAARRERTGIARLAAMGICRPPGPLLRRAELCDSEPLLAAGAEAGFVVPDERWVDASRLIDDLTRALARAGVEIVLGAQARSIHDLDTLVEVDTAAGTFAGSRVVLAAGVWTKGLVAPFGVRLPMQAGKGYSFALHPEPMPARTMYLPDVHVMASPLVGRLRVAGTMEFDGTTDRFNPSRIDAIVRGLRPLLRGVDLEARSEEWVGPRPMTPDGLPVLGAVPGHPRVILATGHNMLGVTLGPATGRVVADLVTTGSTAIDLTPFAPSRF